MNEHVRHKERIQDVRRILAEQGLGSFEQLDDWNGANLEDLAEFLSEEEFLTLLDRLQEQDDARGR